MMNTLANPWSRSRPPRFSVLKRSGSPATPLCRADWAWARNKWDTEVSYMGIMKIKRYNARSTRILSYCLYAHL